MTNTYNITGMTCTGCRARVERTLNSIEGATAQVTLDPPVATITMQQNIEPEVFDAALKKVAPKYGITLEGVNPSNQAAHKVQSKSTHTHTHTHTHHTPSTPVPYPIGTDSEGKYYCPMHCESDKLYPKPGACPVCGMDLVKVPQLALTRKYTCPMHPEIIQEKPGSCPICGMNLMAMDPSDTEEDKTFQDLKKKMIIATAFTLPVFIISMAEMIPQNPLLQIMKVKSWSFVQLALTLPVVFYAGSMFFTRAWSSIKTWNLNMFTLIGIGTGMAFLFSVIALFFPEIFPDEFKTHHGNIGLYFEATAVILTLALLGQLLEARAHSQTSGAIKELLKLAPSEATLVKDGHDQVVSIEDIQRGDLLRIKPGDKIPVDGIITEGECSIDESMITGEPIPVDKKPGDHVTSGTVNSNTSFVMTAEKVGSETLLSQIIQMVNNASRSKAPIQKLADKVSGYFVPIVILIAVVTFIGWSLLGPEPAMTYGLINAIAVLIIACPCALGLATPMSIMVGVGKGAQTGVLIKNAEALEQMNKVDVVIIDKTGTITEGKPSVEKVVSFAGDENELIGYAAALNQHSEHPLAKAIISYSKSKNIVIAAANEFNAIPGKGVVGKVAGKMIALGNKKLMEKVGAVVSSDVESELTEEQKQGKTVSYISVDSVVNGFIAITDSIKPTSQAAIKDLTSQGIEVVMLTGDNANTASSVAKKLGLSSFKADCLPEDKLNEIKRFQAEGKIVAMAGDGINDAPALVQANVGIAMGTGTDVAIESAKITLVKGDLQGIVKAKNLSHRVMQNIKQNLFFAFVYNMLGIPIAAGLLYPTFGILLSPMIAALAMSLSSVSVIVNALRLKSVKI